MILAVFWWMIRIFRYLYMRTGQSEVPLLCALMIFCCFAILRDVKLHLQVCERGGKQF